MDETTPLIVAVQVRGVDPGAETIELSINNFRASGATAWTPEGGVPAIPQASAPLIGRSLLSLEHARILRDELEAAITEIERALHVDRPS